MRLTQNKPLILRQHSNGPQRHRSVVDLKFLRSSGKLA